MADGVYMNARGETVYPFHVFKALSLEAVCKHLGLAPPE